MTKGVHIFFLGIIILFGAILLNALAHRAGLLSWYDFLKNPSNTSFASYVWLFFLYPLGLGGIAYVASRFLNL